MAPGMDSKLVFNSPTEDEKAIVRKQLGTSEEDIRQAVANIRNWLQVQPHLPNVLDDDYLERMYISCKCRTERVKEVVDAYYTLKNKFPEFLMNRDPLGDDAKGVMKIMSLPTMPRLTPELHRVGVITGIDPDSTHLDIVKAIKLCLMVVNYVLRNDYSVAYILLMDLKNVTPAHVAKLTIRDVRAMELIARAAFSKRVKAVHFLNAPKIMNLVLSIVRPALPQKMQKRLIVHDDPQTLFDHVPKYAVPDEMGGTGGSAVSITAALHEALVKDREWFLEEDKYVADESKRPADNGYKYDLFGMDGSFKKLQVD